MTNSKNQLNQPTTTGHPGLQVSLTPIKPAIRADGRTDLDVLLRVQAPAGPAVSAKRLPLTLALVIDRSGSMADGKLDAAKACVLDLVRQLKPEDEVGVIIYDEQVDVLMPLAGAASAQQQLPALLASAEERGSTDLHAGWLAGAQQVAARTGLNRICRVILLSDGQANHGEVSPQRICEQVRQLAQAGVSTTTVGLGTGFNERLMSAIALAGQGSALYGERPEDLAGPFESELSLLSHLAWRDVRVVAGSATSRWKQRNEYPKAADGAWILPSIAVDSEAWAVFSVPMESAARAQLNSQQGKALHVTVRARDVDGVEHVVKASLAALPLMNAEAWVNLPAATSMMAWQR